MSFDLWALYVLTVLMLMSTPGSSQLLMLSNSAAHGFKPSLATAAGDLSANALQMLAAALGLGVLIVSSEMALGIIKWLGVSYLIWHAIKMIKNTKPIDINNSQSPSKAPIKTLYLQGFLTSASNPKAVLFFAALFPQFIAYDGNFWLQFFILSTTYIAMDAFFLSIYGYGAQWIVSKIKPTSTKWINRAGGAFMLLAATILGLKSLDETVKEI